LQNGNFDAVFTAVAYSYPIQRSLKIENDRISMLYPEYLTARSQDLQTIYHDAGQFYMATVEAFKEAKSFWGKNTGGLILSELEVQDLDTETDWKLAEMKYKLLHG
jgi:pseudaminic acid cytidylyltransferase